MSGNSAPPVPPKRNYKNRISSRSAHHPELLHSSLPPAHQQLQSPQQQSPQHQSAAPPANVVVGAGHNVPRILAQQGLKSSSSQQHVALPVEEDEDEDDNLHRHRQQHRNQQKAIPPPQQQQQQQQQQRSRKEPPVQQEPAPRPERQHHNSRYQQLEDDDQNEFQHHHIDEDDDHDVPLHKSLKRQVSSNQNLTKAGSQHKLRNQVEDHIVYDPSARRQSHASNHTTESYSYEDEEIEDEVLDFELAQAAADVFIGEDVEIKGDFQYSGILRLDGKFQGKLITNGDLIIGPKGVLVSDIHTIQRVWLDGGHIYGQVQVEELYITGDALIKGDITCKYLHIYSGEASIMGTATVHPQADDIVPPGTLLHPNLQPGEFMSRKSSQDSLAGGDRRLNSNKSSDNFPSSSSLSKIDPKVAVEEARQAKIAAKHRRKEAKELLKRELETKAKEQAEETERQQQAKQPKMKAPKEKKASTEQPPVADDAKAPSMKQLTPQGSWKISTGEEPEKLATETDHNSKPSVAIESMESIPEHPGSKDRDTDPKWDMKMHASPAKESQQAMIPEASNEEVESVQAKEEPVDEPAPKDEDVVAESAEVEQKPEAAKMTASSALAQFSKLQEEAESGEPVAETPVEAKEEVLAAEEEADKEEEEKNAQSPENPHEAGEDSTPIQQADEENSKPNDEIDAAPANDLAEPPTEASPEEGSTNPENP